MKEFEIEDLDAQNATNVAKPLAIPLNFALKKIESSRFLFLYYNYELKKRAI